jgi:hypothetical protein
MWRLLNGRFLLVESNEEADVQKKTVVNLLPAINSCCLLTTLFLLQTYILFLDFSQKIN